MGSKAAVKNLTVHGIDNPGLEDENGFDEDSKRLGRTNTTLSQVDLDILSKQNSVVTDPKILQHKDSSLSNVPTTSFFGQPVQSSQGSRWNPFRKKSGILNVIHAQSKRNRMVSKHGKINTYNKSTNDEERHERFIKDFFTSMIDLSWSWTIFCFSASFFVSWLLFAIIWYLIALGHGDFDPENLKEGSDHVVCVGEVHDFTEAFLFSLETQHTIGYGGRATTSQCALAIITMAVQSIIGVLISACMAGIFFAKFTKPTSRGETVMFSKNALISMRDGVLYLLVRLGDLRQTHLLECHVSGHFLSKKSTEEGESIPYHLAQMEFGSELDGSCDYIQPFWPLVVAHKIDSSSPLYEYAPRDFQTKQFEVIVTIEGTTPETGNTVQTRTSYLPQEILWGNRFDHCCVAYDKEASKYAISYAMLNQFLPDRTPRMSAKALDEKTDELEEA